MIKKLLKRVTGAFIVSAFTGGMLLLAGCNYAEKIKMLNSVPEIMSVPDEKIRQIDVIELKEADEAEVEVSAPEQKEITMSIEECRALALENNLELRADLIQPTITKEGLIQASASFEPSFTSRSTYSKNNSPSVSRIDATKSERLNTNLSVRLPLRTGGTLTYTLNDTYSKSDSSFNYQPESYSNDFTVSISQPLLRDAGKNASTYSIRVAQYDSKMADINAKMAAIRVIAAVDKAYWNLYSSRKILEVRTQKYELAKTTYEETKRFVEVGVKAKIEIIRTEKQMADSRSSIISAENTVRQRERELKRLINKKGLGMETKTIVIPASLPAPVRYDIDRNAIVDFAIENRMEMLTLELQLARDSLGIENYKNQLLPDLTFDYQYSVNGLSSQGRSGAYSMLTDMDFSDHMFTLSATVPIGNKRAKSRLRQAVYERSKRLATKENREAEIKKDVLNQLDSLETSWQQILANRQNTILADEQYRAEKKQYELGIVNSTDLLRSQTDLAEAKSSEIEAITNYQISLIDFAYATGTLLGESRIEWEPVVPEDDGSIK